MSSQISIRLAAPKDLPSINAIYNEYPAQSTTTYDLEPWSARQREAWFVDREAIHPVTVACREDQVVGWGSLGTFRSRPAYRRTVENSVYVHPSFVRQGVGSALMADQIARARQLGLRTIIAAIDSEQAGSLALHTKHGFVEAGRFPNIGRKFDRWLTSIFMQLMLD
ncbi:GNAT family N-acetyltransferase [Adhaeretor mobilis]|uniref:N-acyltransferase YncA n=1 Tax=Adhaeretor mobilis TaxID=1930276 RepID=A0A517MZW0_9BACT|nr:GNAT family N-acetyltransferase [Adhaeretor mobilis]QDT00420.1 N-acyltransferase YncA [Adhaeretor mobilis]